MADVVLFLASNPSTTKALRLDREYRAVDDHMREGGRRDELELRSAWALRIDDISRELLRWQPAIVHFSGHASPEGLVVENEQGDGVRVPMGALGDLLGIVGDSVRCVVLNACYTSNQAAVIAEHVEFVVGTTASIGDLGAMAFAKGFYRGISFGKNWCSALALGRNQIELEGRRGASAILSYPECP